VIPLIGGGALLVGLSFFLGGAPGVAQLVIYAAATLPGWPIGFFAFGRRHAAGWIAGALLGYALTCLALAVAMHLGARNAGGFLLAWAVLNALTWSLTRLRAGPAVVLPSWTRRDTTALLCALVIVPLLVVPVFRNVGAVDTEGNRHYRAYFTADFAWHVALTGELGRFTLPPTNPYLASQPLHYYWSYFIVPSVSAGLIQPRVPHGAEPILLVNAMCAGLGFVAALFLVTWAMVPRSWAAAGAVTLAILAGSVEGSWVLWSLWKTGGPLVAVTNLNIDAITMWRLQGLTVDGLQRSLWYVPQHAAACALGLIAIVIAATSPARMTVKATTVAGVSLGLAVTFSPFLGGTMALVYGLGVVLVRLETPAALLRSVLVQVLAVGLTGAGIAWVVGNGMVEGADGAVNFGFYGHARRAPLLTILATLGPLLVPAMLAFPLVIRTPRLRAAAAGLAIALPAFFLIRVAGDPVWVGWRAGQIMLVTLPALAAATLAWLSDQRHGRWLAGAIFGALFLVGLPTVVIDAYNAQDISNRRMGPGFRWTVTLTPDQQSALEWVRTHTPADAVVQVDPVIRGRETWTLIPTFAQRRMAAGLPISLLATPAYELGSDQAHAIFASEDAGKAWELANQLDIDFLYLDMAEREALPPRAIAKFWDAPEHFRLVFERGSAAVFAVAQR
jgi:hypothetical protein